ncbi:beta-propeller fold lactonase family protein [Thioflexithrix psekupsensis]|uniref:DUF11 domain-containing protein n=1 Tax=Thioflexithrix psekupsensis TaxID=1570016 RepID=A0A251X3X6_9GAMM|nr:beta-propeller fold lactonase family protein [Thioflexithrix psekupsensis]OUD11597.1 hypothetical protein TPSD3_17055 [Thioflexithrix psekupsensis]
MPLLRSLQHPLWRGGVFVLFLLLLFPHAHALSLVEVQRQAQNEVLGLDGVAAVAVSPDGQHLYAASVVSSAVAVFSRDVNNGSLQFLQHFTNTDISDSGLAGASAVKVSPDGRHVYVASRTDSAVTVLTRNSTTGLLTLVEIQKDNVNQATGLAGVSALAISPDGTRVYAAGTDDSALTVFSRNADTGVLTPVLTHVSGANGVTNLAGITDVAVIDAGNGNWYVYTAAVQSHAVNLFVRNSGVGELVFVGSYSQGMENISDLLGAVGLAVSPDRRFLYAAASSSNAITIFSIDIATGALTPVKSILNQTPVSGLRAVRHVLVSPAGGELYATGFDDNSLVVFNRNSETGDLTFKQVIKNNTNNVTSLSGPLGLTTAANGQQLYTAALFSDAISVWSLVSADLSITGSDDAPVAINSPLTYQFTVNNAGGDIATATVFTHTLPSGVIYQSAVSSQGQCSQQAGVVTCVLGDVAVNGSVNIVVNVMTPGEAGTGILSSTATVTSTQSDPNSSNNQVTLNTELRQSVETVDLKLAISPSANPANVDSVLIYHADVSNASATTATGVRFTATLDATVRYDAVNSDSRCQLAGQQLTCILSDMAGGASTRINIQVTTPATPSTLSFSAQVTSQQKELTPDDNKANVPVNVAVLVFDLAIIDAIGEPISAPVNTPVNYNVQISNVAGTPANNAVLNVTLPTEVRYVGSTGACRASSTASHEISCNLSLLDPVASPSTHLQIQTLSFLPNDQAEARFSVTAPGVDTNQTNNQAISIVSISGQAADVGLTIGSNADTVVQNTEVTLTFTLNNNGPGVAHDMVLNVALAGVPFNLSEVNAANCTPGVPLSCTTPAINPGQAQSFTIKLVPTALGTLNVSAQAVGSTFDPNLPNQASKEIAVSAPTSDVAVILSSTPNAVLVGQTLNYLATVSNQGPSPASGVVYQQQLPAE